MCAYYYIVCAPISSRAHRDKKAVHQRYKNIYQRDDENIREMETPSTNSRHTLLTNSLHHTRTKSRIWCVCWVKACMENQPLISKFIHLLAYFTPRLVFIEIISAQWAAISIQHRKCKTRGAKRQNQRSVTNAITLHILRACINLHIFALASRERSLAPWLKRSLLLSLSQPAPQRELSTISGRAGASHHEMWRVCILLWLLRLECRKNINFLKVVIKW